MQNWGQERENINVLLNQKAQEETKNAKLENYKILEKNVEESKNILLELQEFFKEGIPTDIEIETLIEKCLLIEKYRVEIKNYEVSTSGNIELEKLKKVFKDKNITEGKINSVISEYNSISDVESKIKLNEEQVIALKIEQTEICKKKNQDKNICIIFGILALICMIAGIGTIAIKMIQIAAGLLVMRNNFAKYNVIKG